MIHAGFVMEQALGHVTHSSNLRRWVDEDPEISATWMLIEQEQPDLWDRMPIVRSNWSLKASLRARASLARLLSRKRPDALFLHTQSTALFAGSFMRRIPTVLSMDATPMNYDSVGLAYGHTAESGWTEQMKKRWHTASFKAAARIVTWCQWAKESLVGDYGIPERKITVIPPGVDLEAWPPGAAFHGCGEDGNRPLRLLFVGGDYRRKGGHVLAQAFRERLYRSCELDVVTSSGAADRDLQDVPGARVHHDLTPNCAALRELYSRADLFVFPTSGDCLPIAVMEAMAAGLPVITTGVGALTEEVEDNVNGLLTPPEDAYALGVAVCSLVENPVKRHRLAIAGRKMAEERFDSARNYGALLAEIKAAAVAPIAAPIKETHGIA